MAGTMGTRIAENRKKRAISQEHLAEELGVSSQAVSKWENDISCPDISLLPQIADYFSITIDELLRGRNNAVQYLEENERKDINKMLLKMNVVSAGGDIVKMNLPLALIKTALEIGMNLPEISGDKGVGALKNIDLNSVLMMAESGVMGKILEVKSANGDDVEISIE